MKNLRMPLQFLVIIFSLIIKISLLNPNNICTSTYNLPLYSTINSNSNNLFTDSYYIKNSKRPNHLYVISQDNLSPAEKTMISTLQGLVNNHCSSQIYTLNSSEPDYKIWLNDLKNNYGISYKIVSNPWQLLIIYKKYINGYVLYNNENNKDPSINNACSLASLNRCIAVDESIESKVRLYNINKLVGDCRNTTEDWAYNNLWNHGLNHSIVIQLSPDKSASLRDYAIMTKSLVFYEDSVNKVSLRNKIFSSMKSNSICLGWGPDEFTNISTASKYGVSVVAADWSYNLSTLSSFPSGKFFQKTSHNIPREKNVHYVTFIMSDGDNQQWYLGNNYSSPKWYGSSKRGTFNLGWSISPSIYYLAPTVFNLYYRSATYCPFNDYFIVPPSGNGYMYPSKFDKTKLDNYIQKLDTYMKKVDQKYLTVIDNSSFYDKKLWDRFTKMPNIQGLFYLDYHRHDNYHGEIIWSNNKPIISCRDLLWANLENEDQLINKINYRVNSGETNISNCNAYTLIYVHVWSKNVDNIQYVVDKISKNPKIRIVTPDTFVKLIKTNVAH
ncbi:protein phosphatase [Clostridium botulinum]|uniref:GxGYxYP domain-containing protein n=1 Tax=Clostridium botulinum TaxID=1491 RepID=UPI00052CCF6A|nr:GxGYxYP domain-containing protein [Clostridium botulinum]KGM95713.1 protein phosphatase [Clostridium botulinum D str. CCUG 7971]KOC48038.1 protein phosphatase [Clostridium botulinum]NFO96734.1 protein phosphatase [Clostridium botulinum]OOV52532.1 protein phosphatase [Clostridium botulinum D/C]OOV54899.1 protein phosphatase [Clostridium botulinum D/C]